MIGRKERHDFYNTFSRLYNIVEYFKLSLKKGGGMNPEFIADMDKTIADFIARWERIKVEIKDNN